VADGWTCTINPILPTRRQKIGGASARLLGLSRPTEFEDISFEPHKDEFLLFYGLVGTGRSPVPRALTGATRPSPSAITLAAKTMTPNPSLSTSMIALTIGVRMGLARSVGAWSGSTAYRLLS
jgi:ABC-type sugar transport system ATPase subunit